MSGTPRTCQSLIPLALLVTPFLPLGRLWAQAIGDRPVLNVDGNPDYATQDRYDFSKGQTGIRVGPLELLPSAAEIMAYDSNVFASAGPRTKSALSIEQALLHVTNEPGGWWDVDSEAYVRARRFAEASDQDTTEYGLSASLGGELSAKDELIGNFLAQRRFEARTDVETPNIQQVSVYNEQLGTLSYAHTYNRVLLRYTALAQRFEYDDASQKYRDRSRYEGELSAAYKLSSGLSLVGIGYFNESNYQVSTPGVAGSQTGGGRIGVSASVPELAEFQLSTGYFRSDFDQHLGEISGLTVVGNVVLHPTRLTTVRADVSRLDEPTRIPGAYGKVRTDNLLEIGHSYSRTLNLYVRARVVVDDFETIHRTDRTYLGELGGFYSISRQFVLGAEYDFSERDSMANGASFAQNLVSVSITGRL